MKVAVIGGGYAGMAAAATLAERCIPITVFEAARTLGGRARRVEYQGLALDNGLHVLIGAYTELLRLVRLVGEDPARLFLRTPLTWQIHDRLAFKVARLPAPLHMLGGLLASHGLTLIERLDVIRFMLRMRRRDYRLTADAGVSELLDEEGQKGRARHLLCRPKQPRPRSFCTCCATGSAPRPRQAICCCRASTFQRCFRSRHRATWRHAGEASVPASG